MKSLTKENIFNSMDILNEILSLFTGHVELFLDKINKTSTGYREFVFRINNYRENFLPIKKKEYLEFKKNIEKNSNFKVRIYRRFHFFLSKKWVNRPNVIRFYHKDDKKTNFFSNKYFISIDIHSSGELNIIFFNN